MKKSRICINTRQNSGGRIGGGRGRLKIRKTNERKEDKEEQDFSKEEGGEVLLKWDLGPFWRIEKMGGLVD